MKLVVTTTKTLFLFLTLITIIATTIAALFGVNIYLSLLVMFAVFLIIAFYGEEYLFDEATISRTRFKKTIWTYNIKDVTSVSFIEEQAKLKVMLKSGKKILGSSMIQDEDRKKIYKFLITRVHNKDTWN